MTSEARAEQLARELWDVISGDCFGMTPDPWVCSGDCQNEQHLCNGHTQIVAKHVLAALRAERAEGARQAYAQAHRVFQVAPSTQDYNDWLRVRARATAIEVQETPRE